MSAKGIRGLVFILLDFITGSRVRKNIIDIDQKINNKKDNITILPNLLKYIKRNVPYYENIKGNSLRDFPVINKKDIMANFDAFQSVEFSSDNLHWVSTSGSTGEPFKANQDKDKRNRTIADLIYIHQINKWYLGDKYVYLRAWTSKYSISKFKLFLQNYIPIDIVDFNDKQKEMLRKRLKSDKKIKVILGYASAMESFVHYLEEKGDEETMFNIKVIFTVSDNLSNSTKSKLENMFACPVINRYSNEELGILAFTEPNSNTFKLNNASYYFELLHLDSDEHVQPGEIGRLVITDLYNKSMPFIRYDTGDLAIGSEHSDDSLTYLTSFQGRVADVIKGVNGNFVTAPVVNNYFAELYNVKKYQLIQLEDKKYELKVVSELEIKNRNELINVCKDILGNKAIINVNYVEDIPVEKTGKYKTIINRNGPHV